MEADSRDAYGFTVRPQHLERYREYVKFYKEEEEERNKLWHDFLERLAKSIHAAPDVSSQEAPSASGKEDNEQSEVDKYGASEEMAASDRSNETRTHKTRLWSHIRPSLSPIEQMMSYRVQKQIRDGKEAGSGSNLDMIEEENEGVASKENFEEEFCEGDMTEPIQEDSLRNGGNAASLSSVVSFHDWKEELESLVRGGVPTDLRGELWQAFVGVRMLRIEGYYNELIAPEVDISNDQEIDLCNDQDAIKAPKIPMTPSRCYPEKWKGQIEKDLPRTFPGHPALGEEGRNALRRLLTAYARHNPSVGYCQAMNFFAGLLLLMMPEENAFWTLLGLMDNYFDGYFTEEMVESQVDQLVLEDLVRERFPKLVNHLDYLGVQVGWVTGPWFLSIFVNMLPWESVLRVWDVLLFDGNRSMLFQTALALMELYGPAVVTTKDAADALTLLQSLAGSTFDSSQLVITACMGYHAITEKKLEDLRKDHRPVVLVAMSDRSKGLNDLKDPKALASKLYSFKHDPGSLVAENSSSDGFKNLQVNDDLLKTSVVGGYFNNINLDELDSLPNLQAQVTFLKAELCRLLEEKRSAVLRAEELETELMGMVKEDNRRLLSAKIELLELEASELRLALTSKQEQEQVMVQVLIRMEQEQKVTEDARASAEQDAAAQKYAAYVLQEKYEEAVAALAQMEKRAVTAEAKLDSTISHSSPKVDQVASSPRKLGLLFGLGWRDKNKVNEESA